jgi:hypothetical protein
LPCSYILQPIGKKTSCHGKLLLIYSSEKYKWTRSEAQDYFGGRKITLLSILTYPNYRVTASAFIIKELLLQELFSRRYFLVKSPAKPLVPGALLVSGRPPLLAPLCIRLIITAFDRSLIEQVGESLLYFKALLRKGCEGHRATRAK